MVEYDVRTKKARIKLYREADGLKPKGDALCSYIKPESVQLALTILDGSEFEGQV
jgi:HIV Tat-specific factor 1